MSYKRRRRSSVLVKASAICAIGLAASYAAPTQASAQVPSPEKDPTGAWFQATPYLWMASIKGENTIGIPGGQAPGRLEIHGDPGADPRLGGVLRGGNLHRAVERQRAVVHLL